VRKYPAADGPSEILAAPVFHTGGVCPIDGIPSTEKQRNLVCVDASTDGSLGKSSDSRSLSSVVVVGGRVYATDLTGFVYCLDADTGRVRWRFDAAAHVWAGPLYVDGKLYIGDEDGDAMVFKLDGWEELLRKVGEPLLVKLVKLDQHLYGITMPDGNSGTDERRPLLLWETNLLRPVWRLQSLPTASCISISSHSSQLRRRLRL
jgi:outer membrane protein assembly factor BamB